MSFKLILQQQARLGPAEHLLQECWHATSQSLEKFREQDCRKVVIIKYIFEFYHLSLVIRHHEAGRFC